MSEQNETIQELEDRLDRLVRTQIDFQKEISLIRGELVRLRSRTMNSEREPATPSFYVPHQRPTAPPSTQTNPPPAGETPVDRQQPFSHTHPGHPSSPSESSQSPPVEPRSPGDSGYVLPKQTPYEPGPVLSPATVSGDAFSRFVSQYSENARANLEKFIGENLISLIGIVVLVLGVGIGAKYAIDNNLISPLTRIIIGYIFGFGLVGLAIKFKPKYHGFSAVIFSGGMAIMYFVTYFAYSSYALISQLPAFSLMVMFTVFTIAAALVYSRQVIAHIGLVGAYAVPFLLSTDSGNYLALFTYMALVNTGILVISIKKYWKPIFYTSSVFTWLIFYAWFATKYSATDHFNLALVFLGVFFSIFYAAKFAQKVLYDEPGEWAVTENLVSILLTTIIFYAFCFAIADAGFAGTNTWTFFSYVALASAVILATSFREYGRVFMYVVVPMGWAIYATWFSNSYDAAQDVYVAGVFAALLFGIFYFSILFQRLAKDSFTVIEHTSLIVGNAFVFYGFGYAIMDSQPWLRDYLGAFTAMNAALHFAVSRAANKLKPEAVDVSHVLVILILTFASIAVPVQFDGNTVTLVWSAEAAVLFWYGRTRGIRLFEYCSYPAMVLATVSLFMDWASSYSARLADDTSRLTPIANSDFVTAIVFVAAFGFIYVTHREERFEPAIDRNLVRPVGYLIAAVVAFVLYNMFRLEIENYFAAQRVRLAVAGATGGTGVLDTFNLIWQLNYTLLFLTLMAIANLRRLRSTVLALVNVVLAVFALAIFATIGMYLFSELRVAAMVAPFDPIFTSRWMYIAIRPISYLFALGLVYALYRYSRNKVLTEQVPEHRLNIAFEAIAYTLGFIVASCELVNLMGQFGIPDATKLGLSILWGVYALMLIAIGIAKDKKHLRITAFVLLAVTLVKLFLYDIADLDTIPKTILFVTLGITLLVVSFLYNKYKSVIFKADAIQEE